MKHANNRARTGNLCPDRRRASLFAPSRAMLRKCSEASAYRCPSPATPHPCPTPTKQRCLGRRGNRRWQPLFRRDPMTPEGLADG